MRRIIIHILLLGLLFSESCKNKQKTVSAAHTENVQLSEKSSGEIIRLIEIAYDQNGGFKDKTMRLILSEDELKEYWATAYKNYLEKPPVPTIDFESEMVLLIAAGEQHSGGYDIYIPKDQIKTKSDKTIAIPVVLQMPGPNCIVTEALTSPFRFYTVTLPNDYIADFSLTRKTVDCE